MKKTFAFIMIIVTAICFSSTVLAADSAAGFTQLKATVTVGGDLIISTIPGQKIKSIRQEKKRAVVNVGKRTRLYVRVLPYTAENQKLLWESSDKSVVKVNSKGVVQGVSPGRATVTAKAQDGSKKYARISIIVKQPVESVAVNPKRISARAGKKIKLVAAVLPDNASNKKVAWQSGDSSVAKVNARGVVTALKKGTTKITVTSSDGAKTAACLVRVV